MTIRCRVHYLCPLVIKADRRILVILLLIASTLGTPPDTNMLRRLWRRRVQTQLHTLNSALEQRARDEQIT